MGGGLYDNKMINTLFLSCIENSILGKNFYLMIAYVSLLKSLFLQLLIIQNVYVCVGILAIMHPFWLYKLYCAVSSQ